MLHASGSDVVARVAVAQTSLTPKMARLAAFVADNYVQVAFMNTRELAAAAAVSPATVVRFPALLGYRSFDEFRSSIQDRVNFDLTGVARLQQSAQVNRSPAGLLRRIIDADCESLRGLVQTFSEPQIERFVNTLLVGRARDHCRIPLRQPTGDLLRVFARQDQSECPIVHRCGFVAVRPCATNGCRRRADRDRLRALPS